MGYRYFMFFVVIFFIGAPSPTVCFTGLGDYSDLDNAGQSQKPTDSCPITTIGGVDWILHVRLPDYGWKENTHRAVIALAVNDWPSLKEEERRLMEQQLEVEITKALLRNNSSPIYPNNLALFIHALIATNRNPRDFHGIDLVFHLSELIRTSHLPHPFLLLAMCNAKSFTRYYVDILEHYLRRATDKRLKLEYKALALQAYECAGTLKEPINGTLVLEMMRYLASLQYIDGSFGNVYTTALIVQALASAPKHVKWNKEAALVYLKEQSYVDVNMISTYLIQLALNCGKVKFVKDLFPDLSIIVSPRKQHKDNFIQYSLKIGSHPDVHHTISINVPPNSNFFEIMKLAAENDQKYNFSYYMDKNDLPSVYAISGVPNDAEENLYWRLCYQTAVDHIRHTSNTTSIYYSPVLLVPQTTDHVIYWYRDTDCEVNS